MFIYCQVTYQSVQKELQVVQTQTRVCVDYPDLFLLCLVYFDFFMRMYRFLLKGKLLFTSFIKNGNFPWHFCMFGNHEIWQLGKGQGKKNSLI